MEDLRKSQQQQQQQQQQDQLLQPVTESCNPLTTNIDVASSNDIVSMLSDADKEMFSREKGLLSDEILEKMQSLVDVTANLLSQDTADSLIVLSGCGTSGRLAFMTARSFNAQLEQFGQRRRFEYLIAGNDEALFVSRELAEDSPHFGKTDLDMVTRGKSRVLYVGITCGLSAPYVAGQLDYCMDNADRFTPVLVGFNPVTAARNNTIEGWDKTFLQVALRLQQSEANRNGFVLNPVIGPEPVTGSTRMKSGSATKILLDTIFTAALSRLRLNRTQPSVASLIDAFRSVDELAYKDVAKLGQLIDLAAYSLRQKGHIYYVSACDRLALCGLIDASECKPTYGADVDDVRGFLVGGFATLGNRQSDKLDHVVHISTDYFRSEVIPKLTERDLVVITANGDDEVWYSSSLFDSKAVKVLLHFTSTATEPKFSDEAVRDVILRSTSVIHTIRLVGHLGVTSLDDAFLTSLLELACKLTCNALTTGAFVRLGKVCENFMIDLRVSNNKLFHRAVGIIERFGQCGKSEATDALLKCIYNVDNLTEAQLGSAISEHIKQATERQQVVPLAILVARLRCRTEDGRQMLTDIPIVRQAIAHSVGPQQAS